MAQRTTKAEVAGVFKLFLQSINGTTGRSNGDFYMEYNGTYGGYRITRIVNDQGGEADPFGTQRRKAGEMVDTMRLAINAVEVSRVIYPRRVDAHLKLDSEGNWYSYIYGETPSFTETSRLDAIDRLRMHANENKWCLDWHIE